MKNFVLPILLLLASTSFAQTIIKRDTTITQMVNEVSSKNIEAIIRKLVSFKTRHTLSDTTSKTEGSGAARNWIKAEYEKYSLLSHAYAGTVLYIHPPKTRQG
jgi:hypothetical protein